MYPIGFRARVQITKPLRPFSEVTAKKFFSAASSLSERTETSPGFLFWTVPTTIFAVLGLVYIVSESDHSVYVCTFQSKAKDFSHLLMRTTHILGLNRASTGAIAIVAYQNTLGSGTNTAIIIPTIIAFSIPAVIAFVFVTSR